MSKVYKIINTKYIDEISTDIVFKKKIFKLFKQNVSEYENLMIDALKNKDYNLLEEIVHKAKSNVKILGMEKEAEDMKSLESDLKETKNESTYRQIIDNFIESCQIALKEINIIENELEN